MIKRESHTRSELLLETIVGRWSINPLNGWCRATRGGAAQLYVVQRVQATGCPCNPWTFLSIDRDGRPCDDGGKRFSRVFGLFMEWAATLTGEVVQNWENARSQQRLTDITSFE